MANGRSGRYLENAAGVVDGASDGAQVQPIPGAHGGHLLLRVLGDRVHVEAGECLPIRDQAQHKISTNVTANALLQASKAAWAIALLQTNL